MRCYKNSYSSNGIRCDSRLKSVAGGDVLIRNAHAELSATDQIIRRTTGIVYDRGIIVRGLYSLEGVPFGKAIACTVP